jgi:phosphoglycerol transferase MdoB-like AlkP superfamily enzyme
MIQRIQTLYLLISIICLSIVQFGGDIFYLIGEKMYVLNAYGIVNKTPGAEVKMVKSFPLFMVIIVLIVLLVITIFSFKKLKSQLKLIKLLLWVYGAALLGLVVMFLINYNLIDNSLVADFKYQFAPGMYFIILGFPALFLAHKGIKKDLNLLDSLNRLR